LVSAFAVSVRAIISARPSEKSNASASRSASSWFDSPSADGVAHQNVDRLSRRVDDFGDQVADARIAQDRRALGSPAASGARMSGSTSAPTCAKRERGGAFLRELSGEQSAKLGRDVVVPGFAVERVKEFARRSCFLTEGRIFSRRPSARVD
jgi:hypothetical protein